jgi:hypothetical protein
LDPDAAARIVTVTSYVGERRPPTVSFAAVVWVSRRAIIKYVSRQCCARDPNLMYSRARAREMAVTTETEDFERA